MSTALTPIVFSHPVFGDIRTVHIDSQAWFVATDIARALEYRDATKLVRNVTAPWKDKVQIESSDGPQEHLILSPVGLIDALMQSRRSQSHEAREWLIGLIDRHLQTQVFAADTNPDSTDPRVRIGDLIRMGATLWEVDEMRSDALGNMAVLYRAGDLHDVNGGAVVPVEMLVALVASEMAGQYRPVA